MAALCTSSGPWYTGYRWALEEAPVDGEAQGK